jgi:lysophospholipase L1-like esterase
MIDPMRAVFSKLLKGIATVWLVFGATILLLILMDRLLAAWWPAPSALPVIDPSARARPIAEADALKGAAWVALHEADRAAAKELRWVPYRYWQRAPFASDTVNIDANGVRLTVQNPSKEAARKLWLFGGSTLWGTGTPDALTIPSLLATQLSDANVQITNFGESGYVSQQSLLRLMELLKSGEKPDWVIFYDGVNDVFSALQNGVAGWPQNEANRRLEFNVARDGKQAARLLLQSFSGVQRVLAPAPPVLDVDQLAVAVALNYAANIKMLDALAQAYGFDYLAVWQPVIFSKPNLTAFEQDAMGTQAVAHRDLSHAAHREVSALLNARPSFVDLYALFDSNNQPLYLDFCHLGPQGNAEVAAALAKIWQHRDDAVASSSGTN